MQEFGPGPGVHFFAFLQVMGLVSALLARISQGSSLEAGYQRVFFLLLASVGAATIVAVQIAPFICITSCATLSVMVLATVWDFRPKRDLA
jgi:hypothetical protein